MAPLRIGLLVDNSTGIEPWARRLFERICADDRMALAGVLTTKASPPRPPTNPVFKLLSAVEKRAFARPVLASAPRFDRAKADVAQVSIEDQKAVDALNLDIIFDLTGGNVDGEFKGLARHGVWFLDLSKKPEGLAGFWEAFENAASSTFTLLRNIDGETQAIASGAVNTKFIAARNGLFMMEKAIAIIFRELVRVAETGEVRQSEIRLTAEKTPSIAQVFLYAFKLGSELLGRAINSLGSRLGRRPGMFFLKTGRGDAAAFDPGAAVEIPISGNRYWADPFLLEENGETYCFFEDYEYATKKGHISVGRFEGDRLVHLGDALKADYHLSFPYLFRADGELFMLPETNQTQRIEVWRCFDFPLRWELHATALDGIVTADTFLFQHDDSWWLFTNIASDVFGDHCSELHIFEVDGPELKRVTPHRFNPVVFDARTARNAGGIHEIDGRLLRPSQDNAYGTYGYGLNIMEIEELTLDTYREKLVRRIAPDFEEGLIGCHHFDAAGGRFIIDARRKSGGRAA